MDIHFNIIKYIGFIKYHLNMSQQKTLDEVINQKDTSEEHNYYQNGQKNSPEHQKTIRLTPNSALLCGKCNEDVPMKLGSTHSKVESKDGEKVHKSSYIATCKKCESCSARVDITRNVVGEYDIPQKIKEFRITEGHGPNTVFIEDTSETV